MARTLSKASFPWQFPGGIPKPMDIKNLKEILPYILSRTYLHIAYFYEMFVSF
jgi:hypothetical protein